jgi:hypothetical protein
MLRFCPTSNKDIINAILMHEQQSFAFVVPWYIADTTLPLNGTFFAPAAAGLSWREFLLCHGLSSIPSCCKQQRKAHEHNEEVINIIQRQLLKRNGQLCVNSRINQIYACLLKIIILGRKHYLFTKAGWDLPQLDHDGLVNENDPAFFRPFREIHCKVYTNAVRCRCTHNL